MRRYLSRVVVLKPELHESAHVRVMCSIMPMLTDVRHDPALLAEPISHQIVFSHYFGHPSRCPSFI